MTTILHNRRYLLLLLIFASVLVSAVATLAIVAAQAPDTHQTLGARLGSAYIDGKENIVVRVNGYPITQAEFAAERVRYHNLLWSINDLAERAVPSHEWTHTSDSNINEHRRPVPQDIWITDKFYAELLLLETSGQDRVALGELILEYARFSKAVDAGHMPSKAEVADFVDQLRAAHESHFATSVHSEWGYTAGTQGVIEAVGAQRYWSEIYTARATRNLADSSWYQAAFQTAAENYNRGFLYSGINLHEAVESELNRVAIADVEVEIVDADEVKATPEEAIAYLHELWELQDPSLEPPAQPLAVQNLQASETHNSVTLVWDAEPSPDVLGFEILRDSNTGVFQTIVELEPSARRYVDTEGLKPNTGYYYTIRTIPNNAIEEAQIKIYTLPAP